MAGMITPKTREQQDEHNARSAVFKQTIKGHPPDWVRDRVDAEGGEAPGKQKDSKTDKR